MQYLRSVILANLNANSVACNGRFKWASSLNETQFPSFVEHLLSFKNAHIKLNKYENFFLQINTWQIIFFVSLLKPFFIKMISLLRHSFLFLF